MKDWIEAYREHKRQVAKEKVTVDLNIDWFSLFLWGFILYMVVKELL